VGTFAGAARAQSPTAAPKSVGIGDWQIAPTLEVRTRGEYRTDSPDLGAAGSSPVQDSVGVLERTRLGVGAEYGASRDDPGFLRAQVTVQDARAWGTPAPTGVLGADGSTLSSTSLYEGWIEVRTSSARPAFLRIGRQAVTWGDGRLLSNADWSPVARALDAVRGHASAGMFDFELLAAILEAPTPLAAAVGQSSGPPSSGTELYGGQFAASPAPLFKAELSLLGRVRRSPLLTVGDGETYVGSLRVFGEGGGWRYAVEGAYELSRAITASDVRSAWAGAGYVEKGLDGVVLAPKVRLEGDYASGTGAGGTGANAPHAQFDPLLPDVHDLHGAMDLFAWSDTVQGSARVTVTPWTEGQVAAEYRYVFVPEAGAWLDAYLATIASAPSSRELGHEIDVWATWRPWPVLDLVGGYSALLVSEGARALLASSYTATVAHFGYLQATLRVP
jgi:hypothetical protein